MPYFPSTVIHNARLVPIGSPAPFGAEPVDIRIRRGFVRQVAPRLRAEQGEDVVDAAGRWAIPGLWDQHVHMSQWSKTVGRLDVSGTAGPAAVARIVSAHISALPANRGEELVAGYGYRSATWRHQPTVAELDAVSGPHPVVLVSGDGHNGWLNSRALRLLQVPARTGVVDENEWFAALTRLGPLLDGEEASAAKYDRAVADAAARGVVGIRDFEFGPGYRDWPDRFARGTDKLRVRPATYPEGLEEVITTGLRTGNELPGGAGLLTMGPLKIISDGSLNTRTASCREPYVDAGSSGFPRGKQNYSLDALSALLGRAHESGLHVAVHAIGDSAVETALDAFATTGAKGSIEHAQLATREDVVRMGRLGVRASVQPAHLLDDRDVAARCWPDRADRCFMLRSMANAGVRLEMGSDAPVAPLDPWLAMAAAVHRSADDREPWNPAEAISAAEAVAASTDGQTTVAAGSRGDVVLLDEDPLQPFSDSVEASRRLRTMPVAATFLAGRATHKKL